MQLVVDKSSATTRKPRATSIISDASDDTNIVQLHGTLLRSLRKRAGLTTEELATILHYKRPTQVIRRENGFIGVPLSEIAVLSKAIKCSEKLLMFARIAAFEVPLFDAFRVGLCKELNIDPNLERSAFFEREIEAISSDENKSSIWRQDAA